MSINTGIKVCSINICGLSSRSQILLDKYADSEKIDILAVQESGTGDKEKLKLINMKTVVDTNNSANRGAVLYVHNNISCTTLTEISKVSKNIDSAWGLTVIKNRRYIIGSIYVKLKYIHAITEVMKMLNIAEKLTKKVKAAGVILIGDFNARHTSWGDTTNNEYGKQLLETLDNTRFTICTSKSPTFLCENGSSFIDLMIISNGLTSKVQPCYTDEVVELFSGAPLRGHVPLLTAISESNIKRDTHVEEKLDIESINWEEWSIEVDRNIQNRQCINTDDPQELWENLESVITDANHKYGKMKKSTRHSKPYWTEKLSFLVNKMRDARKAYTNRNTDRNKEVMIESKEIFDLERKTACEEFILQKTRMLNTADSVEFWKRFNKLFKTRVEKGIDPLNDENQGIITENSEIEEKLFSTFFESRHLITADFDNNFYETVLDLYEEVKQSSAQMDEENSQAAVNGHITATELKSAIRKTECSNKSLDNHKMHPKMIKCLGSNSLNLMQKLFNRCLETGLWVWETAEVIFLKKEGKESYAVPGSYRPISISSYIGKLLEKIVAIRISTHLGTENIFDPDQEGFTSGRNTIRYLNRLNLEVKTDLLQKDTVIGLFVDFEKAFDSVWKKGLIVKLSDLNIKGKILNLIDNFLSSRKVKLNVNGEVGEIRNSNEYGLPQGSALSPILFKIYLLDLLEDLNARDDLRVYKFADDGTVKISHKQTVACVESLHQVMKSLDNWTRKWRMVVNCQPDKTEYICFGISDKNSQAMPNSVPLGNKVIKRVTQTKVLGLIVDEKLTYTPHSKNVYNKLAGKWVNMCKYSNKHWGFNQKVITQIAKTFFLTSLHYAGHIWMNSKNTQEIEQLWYKIMKSAIGATFNIRKSVAEIILGIPPLSIQNNINKVKHYLKLNIKPAPEDRLRQYIKRCYSNSHPTPVELASSMKEVFKFLLWKSENWSNQFTVQDKIIIEGRRYEEYFSLTPKACTYTKDSITKYTEKIWLSRVRNEFILEGYHHTPKPSCSRLPIPTNTSRRDEVLIMSLMYSNNLFNSHIYRHTYLVESPLCRKCKQEEETPYHIILQCSDQSQEARRLLGEILAEEELQQEDSITLLNGSRHPVFLRLCLDILSENNYCDHVDLT